jgi:hypothetical protein
MVKNQAEEDPEEDKQEEEDPEEDIGVQMDGKTGNAYI